MGQKYLRMKDEKPGLVRKQDAKGEGLEPKVNVFKISVELWRCVEETNVTQTYHRRGVGSGAPSGRKLWAIFCKFLVIF